MWSVCERTYRANKHGFHHYDIVRDDRSFTLESHSPIPLSFVWKIELPDGLKHMGDSSSQMPRRIHAVLGCPLLLRVTLFDENNDRICTLETEVSHENQIQVKSKEEYDEEQNSYKDKIMLGYMQVDDLSTESRVNAAFYRDREPGRWGEVWRFCSTLCGSQSLYESDGAKLAYFACKKGETRTELTEWKRHIESAGHTLTAYALIDPSVRQVYAVEVDIQTSTAGEKRIFLLWNQQ